MNSITASQYQIYFYPNLAVLVDRSCPQYCDEHDIIVQIVKLVKKARTLEKDKLNKEADNFWGKANSIYAEADKLTRKWKLWAEIDKLKEKPCQCFRIPEEVQRRFDTAAKLRCL